MYILHLSDIHYRRELGRRKEADRGRADGEDKQHESGGRLAGPDGYQAMLSAMQNPLVFLDDCLDRAARDWKTIDLVVITGDLTEDGTAQDYRCLKHHIRERVGDIPLVVTLGNHDNKRSFREGWLEEMGSAPYNTIRWVGGTAVIAFDTSVQGVPDGHMDDRQAAWLERALDAVGRNPSILVTHHHLLPEQGQIPPLPESGKLLSLIGNSGVCLILCGHTHHHHAGQAAGRPCHVADSLSFCGDDMGGGQVRFQEKYGFNVYRMEDGMVRMCRSETFANGRILGTLTF
ncbi:metallophosphoesterase [Lachnoclostridium pacaense]|uniref:metallophosphoesterase family protein n=1 Tax=Enterocloster hominis (ex Hitch et al. 2024) TaxID=1917870 RepID=UPI001D112432|nr:metallophosphoesterase [Lachnoclostridium pacaense]MCC2879679.1 metallophosphoesterase [Lachnoclostridium pacaense]